MRINNNLPVCSSVSYPSSDRADFSRPFCTAGGIWGNSLKGPELALCDWQLVSAMQKTSELYADGALSADGRNFVLTMKAGAVHGAKSMGAPFNVYLRDGGNMVAGTYAVKAADTLSQSFPVNAGQYSIDVHAPNGFFRSFKGTLKAPVRVQAMYEQQSGRLSGNIVLQVKNSGKTPVQIAVKDHSYGLAPVMKNVPAGATEDVVVWSAKSHGWYDVSVSVENSEVRYAGRVETGAPSITDPAMGGVA